MPRAPALSLFGLLGLLACAACAGCSTSGEASDAGADASVVVIDVCDAFTGVGTACPLESPVRCFPACEASGCYCRASTKGAVWECVTDLSCVPDCGPLDDGCNGTAPDEDLQGQ
jgi:hypothetical protein